MPHSPQIPWPSLDASYRDQFGCIDPDVHNAGGEIWPWAARFATAILRDESEGQLALLKVCAKISEKRATGSIQVEKLRPYIRSSFKREVLARLKARRLTNVDPPAEDAVEAEFDLDQRILVEEIMARMDPAMRRVTELLILGFTFEEIARKDGTQSNLIRSKYSKQLAKIKTELTEEIPNEPQD
jgi:DNA-directed RNA polymerase specialized sigma24 family protein